MGDKKRGKIEMLKRKRKINKLYTRVKGRGEKVMFALSLRSEGVKMLQV